MPVFNEVFVFFFFHAFIKFSNMHDVFAIRNDQSYNSLLERKHKGEGDGVSEEYIINEYMKKNAYSVGISDLLLSDEIKSKIKEAIQTKKDDVRQLIQKITQKHLKMREQLKMLQMKKVQ
jgi:hypothetical protein